MEWIEGTRRRALDRQALLARAAGYPYVWLDLGTGDGRYVTHLAAALPRWLVVGVDACREPLRERSRKAGPNTLFVVANALALPAELDGIAHRVSINFPWGSLLRAVATGDRPVLQNLRQACSPGALLEVIIGLDPERDRTEVLRLGLEPMTVAYIDSTLKPRYREAGFEMRDRGVLPDEAWPRLQTTWAKRLRGNASRSVFRLVARAVPQPWLVELHNDGT